MKKKIYLLGLFAATYLAYFPINRLLVNSQIFKFPLDDLIPLIPVFSVPYLIFLPLLVFLPVLFFLKAPENIFKSLMLSGIIATLISYLIFFVFPTSIVKPTVAGADIFSQLVRLIYTHDYPYTLFPSGHTLNTVIFAFYLNKWKPGYLLPIGLVSLSIILSTLFVRQHYLPDILGGLLLGGTAAFLSWRKVLKKSVSPH